MRTGERDVNRGPTWYDVLYYLGDLQRSTGRHVDIQIARTAPATGDSKLYFRVVTWTRWEGSTRVGEVAEGSVWPRDNFRTVPALLLALILGVDHNIAEAERKALKQAQF